MANLDDDARSPPQAGGACAILIRCAPSSCACASPQAPRREQAALEDASARAHRGLHGKALREAGLSMVVFVSCGGPTSRANLALRLRLIIKIVVINYNGLPILDSLTSFGLFSLHTAPS